MLGNIVMVLQMLQFQWRNQGTLHLWTQISFFHTALELWKKMALQLVGTPFVENPRSRSSATNIS